MCLKDHSETPNQRILRMISVDVFSPKGPPPRPHEPHERHATAFLGRPNGTRRSDRLVGLAAKATRNAPGSNDLRRVDFCGLMSADFWPCRWALQFVHPSKKTPYRPSLSSANLKPLVCSLSFFLPFGTMDTAPCCPYPHLEKRERYHGPQRIAPSQ